MIEMDLPEPPLDIPEVRESFASAGGRHDSPTNVQPANDHFPLNALADAVAERVVARLRGMPPLAPAGAPTASGPQAREPSSDGEWLTAHEAALYLGFQKENKPQMKAFYSAFYRRQIPGSRLGRRLRFNRTELDRFLLRRQGRVVQSPSRVPSPRKDS